MLFQSGAFLIFFPIVILLFYLIPKKGQMPFFVSRQLLFLYELERKVCAASCI